MCVYLIDSQVNDAQQMVRTKGIIQQLLDIFVQFTLTMGLIFTVKVEGLG